MEIYMKHKKRYNYKVSVKKVIIKFVYACEDIIATLLYKREEFIKSKSIIVSQFLENKKKCNKRFRKLAKINNVNTYVHIKLVSE